ncbi:MAG: CBS domain-containing protein [Spirochaetales bacterium]
MQTIPLNTESSPEAVIELLFKLKTKDVMETNVITAPPTMSMRDVQLIMKEKRITGVPVTMNKKLAGIVSMDDIVNAFDKGTIDEPCENHMTRNTIVLQENMPISFAVSYFNKYKFGRFPVLNSKNNLVGIVTTSDVIAALLVAMNREVERLEKGTQEALRREPHRVMEFKTEPFNFETAGQASTEIKKTLRSMNVSPAIARRVGIASYELEINQVVHSDGGIMRYYITGDTVVIEAIDTGPGIPDIEKALTEGFSTATDQVRSLGFGAGMGIPNTKRVSDNFSIESEVGKGTVVHATFSLKNNAEENNDTE